MKACEIMTRDVAAVRADTPTREVARLLLARGISAVPVVDDKGAPVGMVSEGDLIGRGDFRREGRRDWWLAMLAEGEALNPDFLASLRTPEKTAGDVMAGPVVTAGEETDVGEIARLLATYRIKRVPVLRDGRIVGIVSRADLLRALAHEGGPPPKPGLVERTIAEIDHRFGLGSAAQPPAAALTPGPPHQADWNAADFRELAAAFERRRHEEREKARQALAEQRIHRVAAVFEAHVSEQQWRNILHQARCAAENGAKELLLLRFPSQACSDAGRAINVAEPGWPATLRGDAAELYLRWERDLKPRGFHVVAEVLDFPGGLPGDIGLFLRWGL